MFLSFFYYLFLTSQNIATEDPLVQEIQNASAASTIYETIEGTDTEYQLAFKHSLPAINVQVKPEAPIRLETNSLGIIPTAKSAIVIDSSSGAILYERNSEDQRSIASITKLMTALTIMDQDPNMDEVVTILGSDHRDGGRVRVYSGEEILYKDVLSVALIASDNVAMVASVRHLGYSIPEFVDLMNKKAESLGMTESSFIEPTGIRAGNKSTAKDISTLLQEVMKNEQLVEIISQPSHDFTVINKQAPRSIESTNQLFDSYINQDPYSIKGGKTGFTFDAGYCLAVMADSSGRDDDIIVVALGSDSLSDRFNDVKGLIDWTYSNYTWE